MLKDKTIKARVPAPFYNYFSETKRLTGISISEQVRSALKLHLEIVNSYRKNEDIKKIVLEIEKNNKK